MLRSFRDHTPLLLGAVAATLASLLTACAGDQAGDISASSGADLSGPAGPSSMLAAGSLCGHYEDAGPDVVTGKCSHGLTCSRGGHVGVDFTMSCQSNAGIGGTCGEQAGGSHGSDLYTAICPSGTECTYEDDTAVTSSAMVCRYPGVVAAGGKCGENTGHGGELIVATCAAGLECGFIATDASVLYCR